MYVWVSVFVCMCVFVCVWWCVHALTKGETVLTHGSFRAGFALQNFNDAGCFGHISLRRLINHTKYVYQLAKAYVPETSCIMELLLHESSSKATTGP